MKTFFLHHGLSIIGVGSFVLWGFFPKDIFLWMGMAWILENGLVFFFSKHRSRKDRALFELVLGLILAIDAFSQRFSLPALFWLTFPLFLAVVYARFSAQKIWMLFLFQVILQSWRHRFEFPLQTLLPLIGLGIWVGFSLGFRWLEKRKRKTLFEKLETYERDSTLLIHRSQEREKILGMEGKERENLMRLLFQRDVSIKSFLEILQKVFQPYTCALYLFDPLDEVFLLKEYLSQAPNFAQRRIQPCQGIFQILVKENVPFFSESSSKDLRGLLYYEGRSSIHSVCAVPLRSEGVLKGALILDHRQPAAFLKPHIETIHKIGMELAKVMDQAEIFQAYFHLREELSSFYEASASLNQCFRMEDVLQTLLASTQKIVPYDTGIIVLHDSQSRMNRVAIESGKEEPNLIGREFSLAPDRGLVSWVIQNQTPLAYNDFRQREGKTPLFHQKMKLPNFYESVVILPMKIKEEPMGAVVFLARRNQAFSKTVRKMLEVVVFQAGISLKNAMMVHELETLATTDGLTGLSNHRVFQEKLQDEVERSHRHKTPTSLLLIDVDHFKHFNDQHGHPVGDLVLKHVARLLREMVRKVDTVARYGGEEFAVVLSNTPIRGGIQMGERIVQQIQQTPFSYQGKKFGVTVSVGIAACPQDAQIRERFIQYADQALYESKKRGRNQATAFSQILFEAPPKVARTIDHPVQAV